MTLSTRFPGTKGLGWTFNPKPIEATTTSIYSYVVDGDSDMLPPKVRHEESFIPVLAEGMKHERGILLIRGPTLEPACLPCPDPELLAMGKDIETSFSPWSSRCQERIDSDPLYGYITHRLFPGPRIRSVLNSIGSRRSRLTSCTR